MAIEIKKESFRSVQRKIVRTLHTILRCSLVGFSKVTETIILLIFSVVAVYLMVRLLLVEPRHVDVDTGVEQEVLDNNSIDSLLKKMSIRAKESTSDYSIGNNNDFVSTPPSY